MRGGLRGVGCIGERDVGWVVGGEWMDVYCIITCKYSPHFANEAQFHLIAQGKQDKTKAFPQLWYTAQFITPCQMLQSLQNAFSPRPSYFVPIEIHTRS
jgi:hypothetical protein